MYSPKISEDLVHALYFAAKDRKMPMTKFVNAIVREALASNNLPHGDAPAPICGVVAKSDAELQQAVA